MKVQEIVTHDFEITSCRKNGCHVVCFLGDCQHTLKLITQCKRTALCLNVQTLNNVQYTYWLEQMQWHLPWCSEIKCGMRIEMLFQSYVDVGPYHNDVMNDICPSLELKCQIVPKSYYDIGNHDWILCLPADSLVADYSVCVMCLKHYHVQRGRTSI